MIDETKHENSAGHGSYEHSDLSAASILYFLLSLLVVIVICLFGLRGLYDFLDHRERASQTPVNPLLIDVPSDTRHVAAGYPRSAFPEPRLEVDERSQLNSIRLQEENVLHSYGWVDEKAGVVRIPIERAMDLLARRGLPVRPQSAGGGVSSANAEVSNKESKKTGTGKKGTKK